MNTPTPSARMTCIGSVSPTTHRMRCQHLRRCGTISRGVSLVLGLALLCLVTQPAAAGAQIQRNPTGVNVNANGATTVFITFGNLDGYDPVEAIWCGELVPASPAIGDRCDPGTVFGSLPIRLDRSRRSGDDGFTDIMSIPPSVARRAYQAAAEGADSRFFYVRRFVDPQGLRPDQFVTVTCRLTGGGARTPLALLDVQVAFTTDEPVLAVRSGRPPPELSARISYNGTGRLVGRWEIVMPGDEPPTTDDLLTEATLPAELRGTQRRYAELERFNIFLPPTGEVVLDGPDPESLPTDLNGLYQVLLRIEASDDKEGDSDLGAAGAGQGIVSTGAVAGFPIPPLRYFVGDATPAGLVSGRLTLLSPTAGTTLGVDRPLVFSWNQVARAVLYRVEVRTTEGEEVVAAIVQPGAGSWGAPPWVKLDHVGAQLEWRVLALDGEGEVVEETGWVGFGVGG